MPEIIPIGADHAGFELKQRLVRELQTMGLEPLDLGTNSTDSTDYPIYAHQVAERVARGTNARGILICGTGLGMSYTANRYHGVRAAVAWSPEIAHLARTHGDANVLVLPGRFLDPGTAVIILKEWLNTPFEGGRHARRIAEIEETASHG